MYKELVDRLEKNSCLNEDEYLELIRNREKVRDYAAARALETKRKYYGNSIFVRALIEFSNYCRNNCYYCGIRAGNAGAERYRLSGDEILACADEGYRLGFRTFVMQSGEDPYFTDEILCGIIRALKDRYPDCAVTLSLGERSDESYRMLRQAGADRYLLRHETCNPVHYSRLHPGNMSHGNRIRCLEVLKSLGYQVGAGFMVGSPYQTEEDLAREMVFLRNLNPHMVGIGPFIPHKDTPFAEKEGGSAEMTLFLLSLIRLTLPRVLLPATTALGTIDPSGREKGILSGANVLMPNISPLHARKKYMLYDNKICTGEEAAQCIECLKRRVETTGSTIVTDRGDYCNGI